jgi:hypothetical protein
MQKKNILLFILAIAITGAAVGYYYYNKGPADINRSHATKINAVALYQVFLSDPELAKKNYTDKILEVTGVIKQVSKNQLNQVVVMLQTNEAGAFVNCTLEKDGTVFTENRSVALKGICTGMGMGDADLGIAGDVYLIRCYAVN